MKKETKEGCIVDNAVIMAAGLSSRFAPLSYEYPKALLEVKGEILIERQIKQLKEVGIHDISLVVGYKKELFYYLVDKFNIEIIENSEYKQRNNHSSLYYAKDKLSNTYICSADNYFTENVFEKEVKDSYYSAVFHEGETDEWTLETDEDGLIKEMKIGGKDSWVILGHAFISEDFSNQFVEILDKMYHHPETKTMFWEDIYLNHIEELDLYIRKYDKGIIYEFDSLDELREFDESYWKNTRSEILKEIAKNLAVDESKITGIKPIKNKNQTIAFDFLVAGKAYEYHYDSQKLTVKKTKTVQSL